MHITTAACALARSELERIDALRRSRRRTTDMSILLARTTPILRKAVAVISARLAVSALANLMRREQLVSDATDAYLRRVGEKIKQARRTRGWSQETASENLSMHRTYYSAIERGEKNVTIATLLRVCNELDLAPSAVLKYADFN